MEIKEAMKNEVEAIRTLLKGCETRLGNLETVIKNKGKRKDDEDNIRYKAYALTNVMEARDKVDEALLNSNYEHYFNKDGDVVDVRGSLRDVKTHLNKIERDMWADKDWRHEAV